ncbi:unnamed protein product [Schistosoma margrebowiei]|uniref:Uncharacterized protein n=1 Tax=Schistosoma margrebowiei TaxID=48269 RepID=A0A183LYG6_9TREM|nr:unnamed protein product [Schistosoma margrebowiei]
MHIIITGFGLYGSCEYNSSSLAVNRLRQIWNKTYTDACTGIKLHTIENVPVTYKAVDQCVNSIWKENPVSKIPLYKLKILCS